LSAARNTTHGEPLEAVGGSVKIFISQSGERSRQLALAIEEFIAQLIAAIDVWVSPTDIEKGTRWANELASGLEAAEAGIICLTSDNLTKPWILFEAGALSRKPKDKVWTLLLDVAYNDVDKPLEQFQHTTATKDDMWKLVQSINNALPDSVARHKEAQLQKLFEQFWGPVEQRITEIRKMPLERPALKRSTDEKVDELLSTVRTLDHRAQKDSWRVEKSLSLLNRLFRHITGVRSPSLDAMRQEDKSEAAAAALAKTVESLGWESTSKMPMTPSQPHRQQPSGTVEPPTASDPLVLPKFE
jgi:TIR domain-containing protein